MTLLVNQHCVPVFCDKVNAFARVSKNVTLFAGYVETGPTALDRNVKVVRSIKYNRASKITRTFTWLAFAAHYFFFLLFAKKPTHIVVVTNPPLAPIVTACIASIRSIPFSVILYDLYPDALFQTGVVSDRNFIFRIWRNFTKQVFRRATNIFTLSESMKAAALRYTDKQSKIFVIPNWSDASYIKPIEKSSNDFIRKHHLESKFIVLYSGNMGMTHDLESLVYAAELLKANHELLFLFIGDGGKKSLLEKIAKEKALPNVKFLPYQDEVMFPQAMASADIGVVTLGTGGEGISVPSKTYVALAAGLCILTIAPEKSELAQVIGQHDAGFWCEPGKAERVASTILHLYNHPADVKRFQFNARQASMHYTKANANLYADIVMSRTVSSKEETSIHVP